MSENNDGIDIKYFMTPYGYCLKEKGTKYYSALSGRITEVLDKGSKGVEEFAQKVIDFSNDCSRLYRASAHEHKWKTHTFEGNDGSKYVGYKIDEDPVYLELMALPVPDTYNELVEGKHSAFYLFQIANKNNDLCYQFGMGFYTEDLGQLDHLQFTVWILEMIKYHFTHIAKHPHQNLPHLEEDIAALGIMQKNFMREKFLAPNFPGYSAGTATPIDSVIIDSIRLIAAPTIGKVINLVEDGIVQLVPGVIAKLVVYLALQLLNYLLTDHHKIKYVIVNRSHNSFKLSNPYSINIDEKYYPKILKNPESNILNCRREATTFLDGEISSVEVISMPSFVINSTGYAGYPPGIMLRLDNAGVTTGRQENYIENIYSAYKVNDEVKYGNTQGVEVDYDSVDRSDEEAFDSLTTDDRRQRCVKKDHVTGSYEWVHFIAGKLHRDTVDIVAIVRQHTNSINGLEKPEMYVLLVIDQMEEQKF